jgi:DNA-nicking Smr family endonuclease
MILDLHGTKHEDVQKLLDSFIYNNMKRKTSRVYVITGNSPEMKSIVTRIANEHGLTAVENMFNSAEILIDFV